VKPAKSDPVLPICYLGRPVALLSTASIARKPLGPLVVAGGIEPPTLGL
jgi:hypothetical protein